MTSLYILIGIVVFFAIALTLSNGAQRRKGNHKERETLPPVIKLDFTSDSLCCGAHEVCEDDTLIAAFDEDLEYFDDEELDRYKLRDSSKYSEQEADEFREIFYSILDEEKQRWIRSLQLREISVPDQMKDEILMVVCDIREAKLQHA